MNEPRRNVLVFRVVAAMWLVGWYWKAWYIGEYFLSEIWSYRVHYAGLPSVLVHPAVVTVAWLAPALAALAIVMPRRWTMRAASMVITASAFIGCLHFETFYDATFVTSFWAGLWLSWFAANIERTDAAFLLHARVLAQCTVGLVFLGGAVGKLTGAYLTNGDALFHLYLQQKPNWPYPWLRDTLSPTTLHTLALWFSRGTVGIELLLSLCPLMPSRIAAIGAIFVITAMVVVSTFFLMSVMACLLGLLVAVLLLRE